MNINEDTKEIIRTPLEGCPHPSPPGLPLPLAAVLQHIPLRVHAQTTSEAPITKL